MDDWINIGDTGVTVLELLDLLQRGRSRHEIIRRHPALTDEDISRAAGATLRFVIKQLAASICTGADRQSLYPGVPPPVVDVTWTNGEDEELLRLSAYAVETSIIARLLRRTKQEIRARLEIVR